MVVISIPEPIVSHFDPAFSTSLLLVFLFSTPLFPVEELPTGHAVGFTEGYKMYPIYTKCCLPND